MKTLSVLATGLAVVAAMVAIQAWPVMLVVGALHHHGFQQLPALGFFQTAGWLFLLSAVGSALRGATVEV